MAPGWMQLALVALVALLLFGGRGKISSIMGDMAKGIKSFRSGLLNITCFCLELQVRVDLKAKLS